MKLLQAARLSRLGDASTGLDKQDDTSKRFAIIGGHEITGTAADADVSGAVSPWKRPELGPWLTDPAKIASYDGIVASALDRLGRSARDLHSLRCWAEDNGKQLIVLSPSLQWPPSDDDFASPIVWDVLGRLAEYELRMITKRANDTLAWLRTNKYLTGKAPFGFRIVPKGPKHKTLEPDPVNAEHVRQMVNHYLDDGWTFTRICQWLDIKGVKPAGWAKWTTTPADERGPEPIWAPESISQILHNPVLIGRLRAYKDGKRFAGPVILRFEPILDMPTWKKLQAKLESNPGRKGAAPPDAAMLTGVLFCAKCAGIMYRFTNTRTGPSGKVYVNTYYRCHGTSREPSQCRNMIPMKIMHAVAAQIIRDEYGDWPHTVPVLIPGDNYETEIADIKQDLRDLDQDDPDYDAKHDALRAELARLRALPAEPDRSEPTETGETVWQHWQNLDDAGRRQYLLDLGIKFYAHRPDKNADPVVTIDGGELFTGLRIATGLTRKTR